MNLIQLRFTLSNSTLGDLVVTNPVGWNDFAFNLSRDKKYGSVIESIVEPLTFVHNAIPYLQDACTMGVDTAVTLLIELSRDFGATWAARFSGLIDLESKTEIDWPTVYKMQFNVKRNDMWAAFLNRQDSPTDVQSATDLDGNAVAPATLHSMPIPNQTLDKKSRVEGSNFDDADPVLVEWDFTATNIYGTVDFPVVVFDELEDKFTLSPIAGTVPGISLFSFTEDGVYDFDFDLLFNGARIIDGYPYYQIDIGYVVRVELSSGAIAANLTRTDLGTNAIDGCTRFKDSFLSISVNVGDQLTVTIINTGAIVNTMQSVYGGLVIDPLTGISFIRPRISVLGHTTAPDSVASVILTHDLFAANIKRTCGADFYSEFYGGAAQGYPDDGCGYGTANLLGGHLRGLTFVSLPLSRSLNDIWAGANPLHNLGLGPETIGGVEKIRVEEKTHFYDSSSNSILLSFVNNVKKTFKVDGLYKNIEIGYAKWKLTAGGSSIDDPQTQHKYTTPFRLVGQSLSLLSNWIGASLLFEYTRRAVVKAGETFDTDNDVFVLKVLNDLSGPDLDGTATGLLNYAERYNKSITPARALLRWINVFNVGIQQYLGGVFKFGSGVGNTTCSILTTPDGCRDEFTGALTEDQDIPITNDQLTGIDLAFIEDHDLSIDDYDLILADKHKTIGVSETDAAHVPHYIENVDFFLFKGKANFTLLAAV